MQRVVDSKPTAILLVSAEGQSHEWWSIKFKLTQRVQVGKRAYIEKLWKAIPREKHHEFFAR